MRPVPPSTPRPPAPPPPAPPPSRASAGGALIALGAIAGPAAGFLFGEATPGFLIGTGAGIAAAVAIWWRERQRG